MSRGTGKRRATIRDVATKAGVSVGTVSRVLNGKSVSARVLESVNSAIKALQYTPNAVAQSMRTQSTRAIGLVVNDISNPLFSGIAKGIDDHLAEHQYLLLIASTNNDARRERVVIESLKQRRVDGLAIAVTDEFNTSVSSVLKSIGCPVVLLDRDLDIGADSVCDDHSSGMIKAIRYLFDLGHSDIALIVGEDTVRPSRERVSGFRSAYRAAGRKPPEHRIIQGKMNSLFGYEEASKLFESKNRPTAIIAGGNQILAGVLRAIRQYGVNVPGDISLISCDEVDLAALTDPPITVISRDIVQVGRLAAELLLRRIAGSKDDNPLCQTMPTELVVRDSCARVK